MEIPHFASYNLSGMDTVGPICILQVCQEKGQRIPEFCLFRPKSGVSSTPQGWKLCFQEEVVYEATSPDRCAAVPNDSELFHDMVSGKLLSPVCVNEPFYAFLKDIETSRCLSNP